MHREYLVPSSIGNTKPWRITWKQIHVQPVLGLYTITLDLSLCWQQSKYNRQDKTKIGHRKSQLCANSLELLMVTFNDIHIGVTWSICLHMGRVYMPGGFLSYTRNTRFHDDVIKWKDFPRCWPFVQGIHRWPVNCSLLLTQPEIYLSKCSVRRWHIY